MRRLTIAYSMIVIWTFGWLTATFGFLPSLLASTIILAPAAFGWRMIITDRAIKRREYGYLGVVTLLAIAATVFIVTKWYDTGLDRLAMFDREYHAFHRHVSAMPEFKNVEISYTRRKGGRVYLRGSVATKAFHERLLGTIDWMVRNNDGGFYDGVEYPGKPDGDEKVLAPPNGTEQTDEPKPE